MFICKCYPTLEHSRYNLFSSGDFYIFRPSLILEELMTFTEKLIQKKNLWHVGAIALFLLITVVYFTPAFQGYTINQGDVTNWSGAAQEIKDYRETFDEDVHWTNSMFSGMPGVQISYRYTALGVINTIHSIFTLGLPAPANYLFLYFVGFYILSLVLKIKPSVGMLGGVAYGLSSYFIIILQAGHNTKALAIGYAPLVLASFLWAYRSKKMIFPLAVSALFMALELRANHVQITYYLGMILVFVGIFELIKAAQNGAVKKFAVRTIGLFVVYGFAIGLNYGNLKGTLDYAKYTTRGGSELTINADGTPKAESDKSGLDAEYITQWSYGIGESFTLLVPNFKGGATQGIGSNPSNKSLVNDVDRQYRQNLNGMNQYWGEQPFTSGPVYVGVIVVFLAILALVYLDDKLKWALLGVTILTLMLSWGKNFMGLTQFFIDILPGYGKFRAVTIILFVVELTLPLLAVLFLNQLIKKREEIQKNIKPFLWVSGGFLVLFLIFLAAPNLFNSFLAQGEVSMLDNVPPEQIGIYQELFDQLEALRIGIFRKDVLRTLVFLVLGIGTIYMGIKNSEFTKKAMVPIIGLLILIDLFSVDTRYLGRDTKGKNAEWIDRWKQEYPLAASAGDKEIFAIESQSKEVNNEVKKSVDAVKAKIKAEKIKGAQANRMIEQKQFRALNRTTHFRVFEQGNPFNSSRTSYFHKSIGGYHGAKLAIYQELIEFHLAQNNPAVLNMLNMKYKLMPGGGQVETNNDALGNAWFVNEVKEVQTTDEEILALSTERTGNLNIKSFEGFKLVVNGEVTESAIIQPTTPVILLSPTNDTIPLGGLPPQVAQQDLALILSDQGLQWGLIGTGPSVIEVKGDYTGFNPKNEAIFRNDYASKLSNTSFSGNGTIELTSYHPDKLTYQSNSTENQLAIFSEIFINDGWSATIDGQPAEILRANYVLRAIEIPKGEHAIEMVYHVEAFEKANTLIYTFTFLILAMLGFGFYWDYIKNGSTSDDEVVD